MVVIHHSLKRDQNAPPREREELIDEALRIDPNEPDALPSKASFLMRKGQWQKGHHYLNTALNGYDDRLHKYPGFADKVARLSLLALILGEEHAQCLVEWTKGLGADSAGVIAAEKILGMDSKKERVQKAKELLTGAKEFREFEGTFDEWLGDPARGRGGGRLEGRAVRGISR